MSKSVLVLGLGLMGHAIASCLATEGHAVLGWNRSAARIAQIGVTPYTATSDLNGAIDACEVIVLTVANYAAASQTLLDTSRSLAGKTIINLVTGSSQDAIEFAAAVARRHAFYLDGAIEAYPADIGGPATLINVCGDKNAWAKCGPIVKTLGGASEFVGEQPHLANVIDAAMAGAFYNVALGGFLESASFAVASGLNLAQIRTTALFMVDVLRDAVIDAIDKISANEFTTDQATLDVYLAGMRVFLDAMQAAGQKATLMSANVENLAIAQAAGYGPGSIHSQFLTANATAAVAGKKPAA